MSLVDVAPRQRLTNYFGASSPPGLILVALGTVGVVLGIGIGIASQVLFTQQIPTTVWKALVGSIGAGPPLGLAGGVLLMQSDVRRRYVAGGLFTSLGALTVFELTYPVGWAMRYNRIGTIMYAGGAVVLLGLAGSAMQEWFDGDADATGADPVGADDDGEIEYEADSPDEVSAESVAADSPDEVSAESVAADSPDEVSAETTSDGERVDTQTTGEDRGNRPGSVAARIDDVNSEVTRLRSQVDALGAAEFESDPEAIELRVEEVLDRVDELIPEIDGFVYQVRTLEEELGHLKLGLDRVGSREAQSVGQVVTQLPDFERRDEPREPARGRVSAGPVEHRAGTGDRQRQRQVRPSGATSHREERTARRSETGTQAYSSNRMSSQSRGTAAISGRASHGQESADSFDEDLFVKVLLAVLFAGVMIAVHFFIAPLM